MKPIFKLSALLLAGGLLLSVAPMLAAEPGNAAPAATKSFLREALDRNPNLLGTGPFALVQSSAQMKPDAPAQTLPNGVLFLPSLDRTSPRVAVSLLIGQGAANETAANAGWRRLLVAAMSRQAPQGYQLGATETARKESLIDAAAQLGGEISVSVGDDVVEISVEGESARGTELLKLALALLQSPRLTDENLDEARTRQLDRIGAEDLEASSRIDDAIRGQVFRDAAGNLIAYGLPDNGTPTSLASLDNDAVRALQTRLAAAPLTVSAAGDVNIAGMREILSQLPARAPQNAVKPAFALPQANAPSLKVRELPVENAVVLVSYPLPEFDAADAPAMRVLVAALSDAKGARLPSRLTGALVEGAPQAEVVSAQWLNRRYASELLLTAQTAPANVEGVKNVLLDEANKLRTKPLTATELERARAYARGDWALTRQDLRSRAFLIGLPTALGAPPDLTWEARLGAVSAADVQRVATKYLKPYAVALVMPRG